MMLQARTRLLAGSLRHVILPQRTTTAIFYYKHIPIIHATGPGVGVGETAAVGIGEIATVGVTGIAVADG